MSHVKCARYAQEQNLIAVQVRLYLCRGAVDAHIHSLKLEVGQGIALHASPTERSYVFLTDAFRRFIQPHLFP